MPDSLTMVLPTLDAALKLARACGYVVGVQTPFRDSDRVWIDLAVKGKRPTAYVTGPEVADYFGRYKASFLLADGDGQRVAPADVLAVAKELKLTYEIVLKRPAEVT